MNFLLEIGTEELPAAAIMPALSFLKKEIENALRERGITFKEIREFATPRRLVILIEGLAEREPTKKEVVFGPPEAVAFDGEGKPTKALLGFLKKLSASPEEVKVIEKGKGRYVAVERVVGGTPTEEILAKLIPSLLDRVPFPKRMRWDGSGKTFLRPVRWILALADDRVVHFRWGGVESSRHTYGHRFLNSDGFRGKKLSVRDAVEYFKLLTEHFVEVDHRLRRKKIEEAIDLYGEQFNASVPLREELAEENTFLTEFVHPILGSFEEKYLELPPLVIITVAAHHQRFFCFQREDGGVVPKFLAISNNAPKDDAVVREGFEKVLRARLEDALFFYREDLRTPLESLVPRLKGVLQHPDLGTLYDKTMRLVKLGRHLSERLYPDRKEKVERAAYLSKADLLTEMVKELDELQGYMGFVYAKAQGEDPEVALALWEQYKPKGAEDELPSTPTGTLLSVADKLHDLVGYFGVGEKPRSTADPLGLRRAALGIIRILEAMRLELDLGEAAGFTYRLFGRLKLTEEETLRELENFFRQRLINYLAARYPRELVVAVAEGRSGFEVVRIVDAVERLAKLLAAEELAVAREVYRRVKKILSKVKETYEVDESLLTLPEERELFKAVGELEARFPSLSLEEKVERLAGLKGAVDRFFDNVMVMDKDDRLRKNRIALLQRAKALFESVADLEKLPVKD